ncbi:MAG: hypothetical protein SGI88_17790 [Candidatus Hydrogenedentes bacterium]|nr:hypothetical protein [Candidatus Hydrogenedentota bacterium]
MKSWAHKAIGIVAVLVGCAWVWGTFIEPISRTTLDPFDIIFSLTMLPVLSVPGAFAVFYGVKVFRTPDRKNLSRSVGVLLFFVVIYLATTASELADEKYGNSRYGLTLFLASLAMMPVYVLLSGMLMRWAGVAATSLSDFFSKPFAVLLSVGLQSAIIGVTGIFFPERDAENLLTSIVVFGPVLVAIVFYKLFIRLVGLDNVRPQNGELTHA